MESLRAVDELTIYPIVDNETDFLSSPCDCCAAPDSGIKYTPERLRMKPIRRSQQLNRIADAAHGLSLLLVAETNGVQRTMLFDAGPNPTVFKTTPISCMLTSALSSTWFSRTGIRTTLVACARPCR